MGGYAPHPSLAGIFKSSTNTTHFFILGPYTPLEILSSLESTISCVCVQEVYALNPISMVMYFYASKKLLKIFLMYVDFPVPVGPHSSNEYSSAIAAFTICEYRAVSVV